MPVPLHALFIKGATSDVFDLAEQLGFEGQTPALALSLFEDGPKNMHLQALFATQQNAQLACDNLILKDNIEAFIIQLPDEDWVTKSQQGLPPVEAGRFWVYGVHDAECVPARAAYPIHIEAGTAFGSGHHGTTKGCLLLLDQLIEKGFAPEQVLDLGCGAGTLAIAAAKALQRPVFATDIDPQAIRVTMDNALQNGAQDLLTAATVNGFDAPVFKSRSFDLIFANIRAGPLMQLAPDITAHLNPNGYLILSGILDAQADKVSHVYRMGGLDIKKSPSLAGWTSLLGYKSA